MTRGLGRVHGPSWLPLAAALLALSILWWCFPHELPSTDPWAYAVNAFKAPGLLASHPPNHPFAQRIGVYLPVAAFYRVFGTSIRTTNLWPLIAAVTTVATVWLALPRREAIVGLVLSVTCVPLFAITTALYPDGIAGAFMGASALIAVRRRRLRRPVVAAVLAMALAYLAFLAKETAVWLAPFWLWIFAKDVYARRTDTLRRFHLPAFACAAALGALYACFCWRVWGSPLARFQSVEAIAGAHLWSLRRQGPSALVHRLTEGPIDLYWKRYGWLTVLAIAGCVIRPKRLGDWRAYLIVSVLTFWIGPTSLHSFDPLPLEARMTLPCLPGMLVSASLAVGTLVRWDLPRWTRATGAIAAAAVLLFVGVLPFVQYVRSWDFTLAETRAMDVVRRDVASEPQRQHLLVCSDPRSPEFLESYWGYRYPPNLVALTPERLAGTPLSADAVVFFFVDHGRSRFLRGAYGAPEYDGAIEGRRYPLAFRSGGVSLYRADEAQVASARNF